MVKKDISDTQIIKTAFKILSINGTAESLSIRKIAAELDISVSTFYWHFANKQALLQAMADDVMAEVLIEPSTEAWDVQIKAIFMAIYQTYLKYPYAAELMILTVPATKIRLRLINQLIQILLDAAFAPDKSSLVIESIDHFITGLFADIANEVRLKNCALTSQDNYMRELVGQMQSIAQENHYDAFLSTFDQHQHVQLASEPKFMLGLDIFLAGLKQQLPHHN